MTRLFPWLLRRFFTAFGILLAVQIIIYTTGITLILSNYKNTKLKEYEKLARDILNNSLTVENRTLLMENPLFVYSANKQLVFSNKGKGKTLTEKDLNPIYKNNKIIGYFHTGNTGFAETRINQVFLDSLIILMIFSVFLSAILGFITARISAKKITQPFNEIRNDINQIKIYEKIPDRKLPIAELDAISSDISKLSKILHNQEEYKRKWLSDLAHDLRTPLAGLKSQLEALSDGILEPSPERFRRYFNEIARLESLASSISLLTSIEMLDTINKQKVSIEAFANKLISPFEFELKKRKIVLKKMLENEVINIDEKLMLRAASNILSNALKYMDKPGHIWVKIDSQKIEISNDGPDIPVEQMDLIFSRLYRGDASRTTDGSGLGLSITREIARQHGGEVFVKKLDPSLALGEQNRGVSFIIKL